MASGSLVVIWSQPTSRSAFSVSLTPGVVEVERPGIDLGTLAPHERHEIHAAAQRRQHEAHLEIVDGGTGRRLERGLGDGAEARRVVGQTAAIEPERVEPESQPRRRAHKALHGLPLGPADDEAPGLVAEQCCEARHLRIAQPVARLLQVDLDAPAAIARHGPHRFHHLIEKKRRLAQRLARIAALPELLNVGARRLPHRPTARRLAIERLVVDAEKIAVRRHHQVDLDRGAGLEPRPEIGAREGRIAGPAPEPVPLQPRFFPRRRHGASASATCSSRRPLALSNSSADDKEKESWSPSLKPGVAPAASARSRPNGVSRT